MWMLGSKVWTPKVLTVKWSLNQTLGYGVTVFRAISTKNYFPPFHVRGFHQQGRVLDSFELLRQ
jgi:hypothetical protein